MKSNLSRFFGKVLCLVVVFCIASIFCTSQSDAKEKVKRSPQKGTITIEYAANPSLCGQMIWKRKLGKTMWTVITPIEAIEADLFKMGDEFKDGMATISRGQFDFDNDGIQDQVYRWRGYSHETFYLVKIPLPSESQAMAAEGSQASGQWPQGFGLDWLAQNSSGIFPQMWARCPPATSDCTEGGVYTVKHYELDFNIGYLFLRPFRYNNTTYLLAEEIQPKGPSPGIEIVLRPGPNKTVDEVCIFKHVY